MPLHTYQKVANKDDRSTLKQTSPESSSFSVDDKSEYRSSRWLIPILLAFNISFLILAIVFGTKLWQTSHHPPYCKVYPESGSRIDQWKPLIQEVLFLPDTRYVNVEMFSSNSQAQEVVKNWKYILGHNGMVKIPPADRTGLDPPLQPIEGADEMYTVSGFRQLLCLSEILENYARIRNGLGVPVEEGYDERIAACFDFVRQGIMCAGDVTLEGNTTTRYEAFGGEHSWGTRRECRDWNEVMQWAEERVWDFEVW